ncbi:energy conserving hydrogenase eha transmembrane protein g [hydrocarbon metagenome]|uniref:Energy conserving hydrogenase eha transmembrane protein g n=1 Tax=hydrocarbon metagenome TaxID=938273 RepID=A0A0W8F1C4_9ZZZZ
MIGQYYSWGLLVVLIAAVAGFAALAFEKDDLHRLLLIDLVEIPSLGFIALLGTDLAEALILPGLVVGIAELFALSQIYLVKEGLQDRPVRALRIEVVQRSPAPLVLSSILVVYGVILSGFTGGAIAALGIIFLFLAKDSADDLHLLELASGLSWVLWIAAFFVFMFLPEYWYAALMGAAIGILLKVVTKMALIGTMWGEQA